MWKTINNITKAIKKMKSLITLNTPKEEYQGYEPIENSLYNAISIKRLGCPSCMNSTTWEIHVNINENYKPQYIKCTQCDTKQLRINFLKQTE